MRFTDMLGYVHGVQSHLLVLDPFQVYFPSNLFLCGGSGAGASVHPLVRDSVQIGWQLVVILSVHVGMAVIPCF